VAEYAIFLLDPEGNVVTWNVGAERLNGYSASEIIGKHFSRFFSSEDRAAGKPERELEVARTAGRVEDEGWRIRKDGSRFWANVAITAVHDRSGELRGFAKVIRDVTERRRLTFLGDASAILASSLDYPSTLEKVARLCVPFLADWSSVQLLDGPQLRTVAIAHSHVENIPSAQDTDHRFPPDPESSATYRVVRTGVSELYPEVTPEMIAQAVRDPERRRMLLSLGLRSLMIVPLLAEGRPVGTMSLLASESERRYGPKDLELAEELGRRCGQAIASARAHGALQAEREFLDAVVQQMREGVVVAEGPRGEVLRANEEALRILGAQSAADIVRNPNTYRDSSGRRLSTEQWPLFRALQGDATLVAEELSFGEGDAERTISISATPVRDRAGNVSGAVATFRDVTMEKRLRAQAEEEAEGRELFFGILAHDLRNPLTAILTGANLLLRKGLPESEARSVGRIASSAERMGKLISDLLDLTRARLAGGIPISPRQENVAELCRRIVAEIAAGHPSCEVTFHAEAEPTASVDPDRLAQVLSNLVGNAAEYGSGEEVQVRLKDVGTSLVIEVHNQGDPIPDGLLPVIFNPFRRVRVRRESRNPRGLGLGLFITHEIVTGHGGEIQVTSDREGGTTFRVWLPKTPATALSAG
jgi:PAS domain S-box-containing protein